MAADDDAPTVGDDDAPVYGNAELIPITVPPDAELIVDLERLAAESTTFHGKYPHVDLVEFLSRASLGMMQARAALRRRQIEDI